MTKVLMILMMTDMTTSTMKTMLKIIIMMMLFTLRNVRVRPQYNMYKRRRPKRALMSWNRQLQ